MTRLTIVVLAAWVGACLLFAAVVAPASFRVLPSRSLAGAITGEVLPVLFWSGVLAGAIALLAARQARKRAMTYVAVLLIALSAAGDLGPGRSIRSIRKQSAAAMDSLSTDDPIRRRFGRLHGLSVAVMGLAMLSAVALLVGFSRTEMVADRSDRAR
jgi:hypothetical protein